MDETIPPHSHLSTQTTINNDCDPCIQQSVGETMNYFTDQSISDTDVVVGINPLSSQQARMQELNLLKKKGNIRSKSLHLFDEDGFADVNSFYSSQKSLKESRKQQQLESKQYLHKYQNNDVAARKRRTQSRTETLSDASFSPSVSPSTSYDSQERRDSPERYSNIEDSMPSLPVLSTVESTDIHESDESNEGNQNQNDEYHADNIEEELEEVMLTEPELEQVIPPVISDGNAKDKKKESDQSKRKTTNRGRKSLPRASSMHSRTRPPKSKLVDRAETRPARIKLADRVSSEPKPLRRHRGPQPRFRNMVSENSSASERDTSVDSTGSRRLKRVTQSSNVSDLSLASFEPKESKTRPRSAKKQSSTGSRSSLASFESKTRPRSAKKQSSTGSRSVRRQYSRESQKSAVTSNSVASHSSRGTTKTTKSLKSQGSASSSSVGADSPMYADLLEKGVRKNSKRNIPDAAMCLKKWEPKAHESLAGCERCLGFANRKEIAAYNTNGHHHRIMMTHGGCCKSCKLFPRKNSTASRMCQRCFQDTHVLKLW